MKRAPHTPTPRASILDTKRPARAATLERDGTPRLGGFPPKRGKSRTPHCEQHPPQPRTARPVVLVATDCLDRADASSLSLLRKIVLKSPSCSLTSSDPVP